MPKPGVPKRKKGILKEEGEDPGCSKDPVTEKISHRPLWRIMSRMLSELGPKCLRPGVDIRN